MKGMGEPSSINNYGLRFGKPINLLLLFVGPLWGISEVKYDIMKGYESKNPSFSDKINFYLILIFLFLSSPNLLLASPLSVT